MEENYYEKKIYAKCQVCGSAVAINNLGNGLCDNCGWAQGIEFSDFPDKVMCPNKISLRKAIDNYNNLQNIGEPSFQDFIAMLNFYGEVEFTYKNQRYGVFWNTKEYKENMIEFFLIDGELIQIFQSSEQFTNIADIDGILVRDLWDEVKNADYIQP